ncbi:MAG TPA: hypothetical protein VNO30_43625 [Kofleriaceae bacterium]|nr:hypothetical protein [Kofleriaceae bacterium]
MRLASLRHQLLIAMGLPGCWTGSQAPEPAPPAKPAEVGFDRAACPRDSIPESVCGMRQEELGRCGPSGDTLASIDELKLHVTTDVAEPRSYRRFTLDAQATADYRTQIADDGLAVNEHCCYSRCTPLTVGRLDGPAPDRRSAFVSKCIPAPPQGTSVPAQGDASCPAGVRLDGGLRAYVSTEDGSCCYAVPRRQYEMIRRGRPARVEGEACLPDVGAGGSWRAPGLVPAVDALPRALRDRLSAAWVTAAREEHASIAAFANLSLRLLALGAPPDLVADAHAAALDEIRHAQLSFELASAYADAPLAPTRFADAARMSASGDKAALALETLLDGCINETVAAALADEGAALAADPAVAAALRGIAADEARHAELAWRIVAWCVRSGDRAASAALLAALHATAAAADAADADADADAATDARDELAAHGVLGDAAIAAARAGVLREVVAPCLAALAA